MLTDTGAGIEGGLKWEFGISRCKLLYAGWVNSKVLRFSTGNCVRYPVINHKGKESVCVHRGMDRNLGKLREIVRGREAWYAAVHRVKKIQTGLSN